MSPTLRSILAMLVAFPLWAQFSTTASRITRGGGPPSAGQCTTAGDVGKVYYRQDAGAPSSSSYGCSNNGPGTYGWEFLGSGSAGPTGPTGPTGPGGMAIATPQAVTSGVTTSVVIPFNGTLTSITQALPSCTVTSGGAGTASWTSYANTTTQMTIDFSGTTTAGFTGFCNAVLAIGPIGPTGPTGPAGSGGVTSAIGTAGQIAVSGPTGAVTFSLPAAVQINGSATIGEFLVSSTATSVPRGISSGQWNTGTDSARISGYKARGTQVSPTTVVTADLVTRWSGFPYDGSNYLEAASIVFGTEGTIAATRTPTYISFSTGTDAAPTVLTERMRITAAGNIGLGTTAPDERLTVQGGIDLTNGTTKYIWDPNSGGGAGLTVTLGSASGGKFWKFMDPAGGVALLQIQPSGAGTQGVHIPTGMMGIGITSPTYSLDVSKGVGLSGTARFFDQTATTGSTLVTITPGAAQSAASTVLSLGGVAKFAGTNSTGAGTALLGTNSPAITNSAPYTWLTVVTSDGSTGFIPVWK